MTWSPQAHVKPHVARDLDIDSEVSGAVELTQPARKRRHTVFDVKLPRHAGCIEIDSQIEDEVVIDRFRYMAEHPGMTELWTHLLELADVCVACEASSQLHSVWTSSASALTRAVMIKHVGVNVFTYLDLQEI